METAIQGDFNWVVLKLNPRDGISEAITEIARKSGELIPYHQHLFKPSERSSNGEDRKVTFHSIKDLGNNLALTAYVDSQKVGLETAKRSVRNLTTA